MSKGLEDIQNTPADVPLDINRVGIKSLKLPLEILDKQKGLQHTVAEVDLSVDLPKEFKGTHMSRFLEALASWEKKLSYESLKKLLLDLQHKLHAKQAHVSFVFPYFLEQKSPASGQVFEMDFLAKVEGNMKGKELSFVLKVDVPVMTVCPCSLAISDKGAHSQRTFVSITAQIKKFLWLEDLIEIALKSGSSPVYPLLKREDEKKVTENAFSNPTFVEDVVRNVARELNDLDNILWYKVEVESYESIHNHSAYAIIESFDATKLNKS